MAAGSRGAAAFAAWRTALTRRLCAEPVLAPLLDDSAHGPLFAPYLDAARPASAWPSSRWPTRGTPFGIDVRRLATEALDDAAGHPDAWGDTHVFGPTHALPPRRRRPRATRRCRSRRCPATSTPCAAPAGCPAITDEAYRGSVARYVWDLADRAQQRLGGADGRLGRPAVAAPPRPARAWAEAPAAARSSSDWETAHPDGESRTVDQLLLEPRLARRGCRCSARCGR